MAPRVMFPLPENYFRPVELTKRDEEQFQEWAMALVQETLHGYHRHQCMASEQRERKWKPLKQRGGLKVFRRRKGTEEEDDEYRYLCTGTIEGSLDEVMLGRYADDTPMFRRMSAVYREDLVDCVVLHTIKKQSPANPFFFSGFKWMTVKSPGKGLVKNRDVCWFEQSGLTYDRNGKEIGYHIAQSVDLPSCPPFDESVCVRARISACYLFRRNKSGGTKVFMRGKNNAGGKVLDWVADMKSAELWLRAERALQSAMAYVSTEMVHASLPRDAPHLLGTNNLCEVCDEKTAGMMVSQKECSVCHRITCSRCVIKRRVLSSAKDFLFVERENFCKRCVRFFHDINYRDPHSIAMVCAAAASRCEPRGCSSSVSAYSHTYSHSSHASSDSSDSVREQAWSHTPSSSSAGSASHYNSTPVARMQRIPSSPGTARVVRQDSARSVSSNSNREPIVLYPESGKSISRSKSVRPHADSEASTAISSSIATTRYNASEYSYTDSIDSSYRETTNSPENQAFQKHLIGSVPEYNSYDGRMVRLGSTDELSSPKSGYTNGAYNTPEDMMAQMIRMNIMAERARQMVRENDKFTRKFNFY